MAPRLVSFAALVAALCPFVDAGIVFSSPAAGATLTAGTSISVKWADGGTGASISDLTTYQLFLMVGGNDGDEQFQAAVITTSGAFSAGNAASGRIETTASDDLGNANAYFIKMIAVGKNGGQLTTYSSRFAYSGMTGKSVLSDSITTAAKAVTGTSGPSAVDNVVDSADTTGTTSAVNNDVYDVTYTMQTGLTRYAPMQPVPPKTITATNTQPMYPTSSVSIAKTRLPIPSILTTLTASQTYSVSSVENTVAAASHATDDMAKFLRRWQD